MNTELQRIIRRYKVRTHLIHKWIGTPIGTYSIVLIAYIIVLLIMLINKL
jgi:hypothetical protein